MTTQTWATLSNNAMAAATVVFALAWLAHLAEWALGRQLTAPALAGSVPSRGGPETNLPLRGHPETEWGTAAAGQKASGGE